jgi:PIN domain nuclease of toxin-antitoxin system
LNAYLDTQVAAWLYGGRTRRLSAEAKRQVENSNVLLSPMAFLEIQYLYDRKRINIEPVPLLAYLTATIGATLCNFPFPAIALAALTIGWTSDPFDRLIVAHAIANHEAPLITADQNILENYRNAVW